MQSSNRFLSFMHLLISIQHFRLLHQDLYRVVSTGDSVHATKKLLSTLLPTKRRCHGRLKHAFAFADVPRNISLTISLLFETSLTASSIQPTLSFPDAPAKPIFFNCSGHNAVYVLVPIEAENHSHFILLHFCSNVIIFL